VNSQFKEKWRNYETKGEQILWKLNTEEVKQ
jgi:hypothetical protein